ncbi:hypothetical protein ACJX0J_015913 [Zea mays]
MMGILRRCYTFLLFFVLPCTNFCGIQQKVEARSVAQGSKDVGASRIIGIDIDYKNVHSLVQVVEHILQATKIPFATSICDKAEIGFQSWRIFSSIISFQIDLFFGVRNLENTL